MPLPETLRVGFVVKRYPRFSETFVVREILAHEQAGLAIDIFSLRPTNDGHFQDLIARVRAPVHYLYFPAEGLLPEVLSAITVTATYFWKALADAGRIVPGLWVALAELAFHATPPRIDEARKDLGRAIESKPTPRAQEHADYDVGLRFWH